MAGSRSASGPRKPLTNLSIPSIEPKAEKSKVSSWRRILNRRSKSNDLILDQPEPLRNVNPLSFRVARKAFFDRSGEESEESRRLKERKATLPDMPSPHPEPSYCPTHCSCEIYEHRTPVAGSHS